MCTHNWFGRTRFVSIFLLVAFSQPLPKTGFISTRCTMSNGTHRPFWAAISHRTTCLQSQQKEWYLRETTRKSCMISEEIQDSFLFFGLENLLRGLLRSGTQYCRMELHVGDPKFPSWSQITPIGGSWTVGQTRFLLQEGHQGCEPVAGKKRSSPWQLCESEVCGHCCLQRATPFVLCQKEGLQLATVTKMGMSTITVMAIMSTTTATTGGCLARMWVFHRLYTCSISSMSREPYNLRMQLHDFPPQSLKTIVPQFTAAIQRRCDRERRSACERLIGVKYCTWKSCMPASCLQLVWE